MGELTWSSCCLTRRWRELLREAQLGLKSHDLECLNPWSHQEFEALDVFMSVSRSRGGHMCVMIWCCFVVWEAVVPVFAFGIRWEGSSYAQSIGLRSTGGGTKILLWTKQPTWKWSENGLIFVGRSPAACVISHQVGRQRCQSGGNGIHRPTGACRFHLDHRAVHLHLGPRVMVEVGRVASWWYTSFTILNRWCFYGIHYMLT